MNRRSAVGAALFVLAVGLIASFSCSDQETTGAALKPQERGTAVATHDPVLVVTGDIACTGGDSGQVGGTSNQDCAERDWRDGSGVLHKGTGSLASSLDPDYVLILGDVQYPNGSQRDFLNSPATQFGAFTPHWWGKPNLTPDKFFPVPGNHDYRTAAAAGYFARFGTSGTLSTPPGDPDQGYYAYDIPTTGRTWRAIALNSGPCTELSTDASGNPIPWDATDSQAARNYRSASRCSPSSAQSAWLNQELSANHRFCTIAYWHHQVNPPGASSVGTAWWRLLANSSNQADIVLWGHQHNLEEFEPQRCTSTGCASDPNGTKAFIAGLGGIANSDAASSCGLSGKPACTAPTQFKFAPGSNLDKYAVLKLVLHDTTYDYAYIANDGTVLRQGTGSCHDPNPPPSGTISGRATNLQTGSGISGAAVSWSGGSTTTDAAGNYTLTGVTPGTVALTGAANGYLQRTYQVSVTGGQTTTQPVQLSTSGKIVGTVTSGGVALAGATVAISGGQIQTDKSDVTDAAGHYDQGWVAIGSYTVRCSASGYSSQSTPATVSTGAATTIDCALSPVTNGSIAGVVTNLATGQVVSGATLGAGGISATSAADGSYTLANVPAGSATLTATRSGYLQRQYSVNVAGGSTVTQNVQLSTSGKISGTVTGNGSPLSGATVTISGGQIQTDASDVTDAAGHYDQGWVPIGSYTVTCSASGFSSQTTSATVTTGATTTVDCALSPPCNKQPVITEPFEGQSVGSAINLHASAGSCVTTMKVYIDNQLVQTISGNVSPVPPSTTNWIGGYSEGVSHTLVVVGFANDGGTASSPVHFTWP